MCRFCFCGRVLQPSFLDAALLHLRVRCCCLGVLLRDPSQLLINPPAAITAADCVRLTAPDSSSLLSAPSVRLPPLSLLFSLLLSPYDVLLGRVFFFLHMLGARRQRRIQ